MEARDDKKAGRIGFSPLQSMLIMSCKQVEDCRLFVPFLRILTLLKINITLLLKFQRNRRFLIRYGFIPLFNDTNPFIYRRPTLAVN
jgi:hypothetical protein